MKRILTAEDAEIYARRRLPRGIFESIAAGSEQEVTLRANLEAFREVRFRPRAAVQTASVDLRTSVLGHEISFPVMIAPTGNVRMFHSSGEPAVARAAGAAGTIHIVSCFTGYPIEDVAAAANAPLFFNLYFLGGRSNVESMLSRARTAGCSALVITVDWAAAHQSERNVKQRVDVPLGANLRTLARFGPQLLTRPSWVLDYIVDGMQVASPMWLKSDGQAASMWEAGASIVADTPTWDDIPWIREQWEGPVVIKGIVRPEDAQRAVDVGADAIVVSNHGGRALDGMPATLSVLPEIVESVDGSVEIYLDSGIRRGSDVVKALALGARACLIGRPYVYAHAAAGEAGVAQILQIFKAGIERTLTSLGCPSVRALDASFVTVPRSWRRGSVESPTVVPAEWE